MTFRSDSLSKSIVTKSHDLIDHDPEIRGNMRRILWRCFEYEFRREMGECVKSLTHSFTFSIFECSLKASVIE
jgi:hypothetical protein